MTVSNTVNREQYATDGVTAAFAIHFPFFNDTDVNAIFVDASGNATTLALNADFTVSGGGGAGGSLAANAAPANGGTLTIYREIPFTQEDDYVEDDPLPADTLEGGFDRAVMRDLQLKDATDRALTFPVTVDPGVSAELPNPQADALLGWNSTADGLENKVLEPGTTVYASTANTNAGTAVNEAVTPKGLNDSKFSTVGRHMIPILAAALQPATTNGAAPGVVETATNKILYRAIDYDQTTQEFSGLVIPWPKSADEGTVGFRARWTASAGTPGQGIALAMEAIGFGDDDALDTSYGTAAQVTDTLLAVGDLHITVESAAVTVKNLAEGDLVAIRFKRVPADAADNLAADLRLIAVDLFINTGAGTDA